uniref:Uncharacterized protein n=1 Tax=Aegilops tauschii subsp. strangulata TaxID=200361 RepID=A0A452XDT3_AEGTS
FLLHEKLNKKLPNWPISCAYQLKYFEVSFLN